MELPGWPRAHDSTIDLLYVSQSILALFLSGVGSQSVNTSRHRARLCLWRFLFSVNDTSDCYTVIEMFRLSSVNFNPWMAFFSPANLVLCILPISRSVFIWNRNTAVGLRGGWYHAYGSSRFFSGFVSSLGAFISVVLQLGVIAPRRQFCLAYAQAKGQ